MARGRIWSQARNVARERLGEIAMKFLIATKAPQRLRIGAAKARNEIVDGASLGPQAPAPLWPAANDVVADAVRHIRGQLTAKKRLSK